MSAKPQELTIRCGFEFVYEATALTPAILKTQPRLDPWQRKEKEQTTFFPHVSAETFEDSHGNSVQRFTLPPGRTTVRHDIFVAVPVRTDDHWLVDQPVPVSEVPPELLGYTLPSRYCDSDRLMTFAAQQFGQFAGGLPRVQAICDWVHNHVTFGYHFARPTKTAWDVYNERTGVCRDFQHLSITLCRAMNIPARYATGYLGDIGVPAVPSPMDFMAWFEVYLGNQWHTFDARHNTPRIGRVLMARGRDAVDAALTTSFGHAELKSFKVWTDEVTG